MSNLRQDLSLRYGCTAH